MGLDPEASDRQLDYIVQLLDRRYVTPRMAERIIRILEDGHRRNDDGLTTPNAKPERTSKLEQP